jgi:iron complex outermembrane receptor protein
MEAFQKNFEIFVVIFITRTTYRLMKSIFCWLRMLIQPIAHMQTRPTATNPGQAAFSHGAWLRPPRPRLAGEPAGLVLLASAVTSALYPAQGVTTEMLRPYQIAAQPMNSALMQFAAASGIELVFPADLVRGMKAKRLVGEMSWQQALAILLRGSGLRYRMANNGSVTLEPDGGRSESTQAVQQPTLLPSVKVYGLVAGGPSGPLDAGESADLAPPSYRVTKTFSATRTETPLMQLPQSVQAVDRSVINDQQNITVSESLRNVSSVVPRPILYTPSTEGTLVRGFPAEQLLDGFTQYYNPGDRESTVNVQRIEVLKGSNALFYSGGSGSTAGGVIQLTSKLPQPQAFGLAGFRFGSHDFYQPYVDLNQPLNSNVLFRLTGEYTNARSNVEVIDTQRYNINPAFIITGQGDTTLTLQGKVSRWRQPDYQGLPATGSIAGSFRVPKDTFIGPRDIADSRSDTDAVWANLDHKLNDRWRLNARARYARSSFDQKVQSLVGANFDFAADSPAQPPATWFLVNAQLFQRQEESSFQANAVTTFTAAAMDHTLLIGADLSHLADAGFIGFDPGPAGLGAGTVNLANPSFPIPYSDVRRENNQFMRNTSYGGFAQLQSHAFQRLHTLLV